MSDYTPEDIVKYSISGDGARVKEAIQGVMANKVMNSLEAKKAEVAQSMFNSVSQPEQESQPEVEIEDVPAETT